MRHIRIITYTGIILSIPIFQYIGINTRSFTGTAGIYNFKLSILKDKKWLKKKLWKQSLSYINKYDSLSFIYGI